MTNIELSSIDLDNISRAIHTFNDALAPLGSFTLDLDNHEFVILGWETGVSVGKIAMGMNGRFVFVPGRIEEK